jgi:catechol 2,3-dioxygenase-like lactoylglutathione lyase family enzyme
MAIEHDQDSRLPPLKMPQPPGIPVDAVAAVERVTLAAGDIPPGILKAFYGRLLGLRFISGDENGLIFSHARRQILLERGREGAGQVALIIKGFDEAMVRLRDGSVGYEVVHTDGGMTRTVLLRDPAGNWVKLVETREF